VRTAAWIILLILGILLVLSFHVFGIVLGVGLILAAVWVKTGA
jgi:hypothetical protein